MEILRPLMIRRIQNPQMKRMAIPAMRMLPISLVLLTMEMQIQRIRIHQRILEILTNQTTQMALAALTQQLPLIPRQRRRKSVWKTSSGS